MALAGESPVAKTSLPAKKLVAWFKSEDAGPNWRSSIGKFSASAGRNSGVFSYTSRGYGAKARVRYIQGSIKDTFQFSDVLQDRYTVCSVSRYASTEALGRILQGSASNIALGHHAGDAGVVFFDGTWQTKKTGQRMSTKWTTICASPGAPYVFVDGINVGTASSDSFTDQSIVINSGFVADQVSNWAVMEVMTWNYVLTEKQMEDASTYLMKKLMVGAAEDSCRVVLRNPSWWDGRSWSSSRKRFKMKIRKVIKKQLDAATRGPRKDSQLDSPSGWCAQTTTRKEYLEIDLKAVEKVIGVIIQGEHDSDNWVHSFKVQYKASAKGVWQTIPARFTGLAQKTEEHVRAYFSEPVEAHAIRLTSFSVHNELCLRAAVMVCQGKLENEVTLLQAKTCPTNYNSQSWSESDPASRHLRIGGTKECLALEQLEEAHQLETPQC
ncbi:xlrs1 [Symbiodinium natans]|uniref:Xlrs1 protein n=1 Tax=Symbiodinium natans TaxID=878477 RepID=A0A812J7G0_9DINO|nr:xlrs1 [Symbiodinium natans]